jgi:nucleoside-diphosphate-sugar epimerase
MNVLLTGGTGQLGLAVANFLLSQGFGVKTLGREPINELIQNYSWSLGMSPNPKALADIDCILHFAWITGDRKQSNAHLNIGGSEKIFEAASLAKIRVFNISSLSAANPVSIYGKSKLAVEKLNFHGINLRIAKVQTPLFTKENSKMKRAFNSFIILPVARDVKIYVTEINQMLDEILYFITTEYGAGTYELQYESYLMKDYLRKYFRLRSIQVPRILLELVFSCLKLTRLSKAQLLHDRWISLTSTDNVPGGKSVDI